MRVLVTGSNGLLGQKLTTLLEKEAGVYLISTGKRAPVIHPQHGEYHHLDITDAREVTAVVASLKPEVVIHTAAMTQVDQCEQDRPGCWNVNVRAVEYIAQACEAYGAHLIHLSTDFIFDGSHGPLSEEEAPCPINYYGESKAAAEGIVIQSKTPWTIIRTVLVYGVTRDMSRSNIVLWVKENLEQGKTIRVVNDQWRTPTLAEDLAMGCYLAAKKKATGVFHISGSDFLSPYEIALRTADYFSLDKSLIVPVDSTALQQPAKRPARTGFIIEKARVQLGYTPHTFTEGIQVIVDQMANPDLA
jgi:dTDP-4-dehydrorhamnose reductase